MNVNAFFLLPMMWLLYGGLNIHNRDFAAPSTSFGDMVTIQAAPTVPGWMRSDIIPDLSFPRSIIFAISTTTPKLNQLYATLLNVSDPNSPSYGNYLTMNQLSDLVSPGEASLNTLAEWLTSRGMGQYFWSFTQNKDMLIIECPLSAISNLFNVQYYTYYNTIFHQQYTSSPGPWHLPSEIAVLLDFVTGVVGFPGVAVPPTSTAHSGPSGRGDDPGTPPQPGDIIPAVVRESLNIPADLLNQFSENSQAIAQFQGQSYDPRDLALFFQYYVTTGSDYYQVSRTLGFNQPANPGLESSLDSQYLMGVSPNVSTWIISVNTYPFWSDMLKWLTVLANNSDIPFVHSISYGSQLIDNVPPDALRRRYDLEFLKLGVRGRTIVFASGDQGSGCQADCLFWPSYPASSPFVLAVGSTGFYGGTDLESATQSFASGGGFSSKYPMPYWQKKAVDEFFSTAHQTWNPTSFNASGRGTPDVAALGSVNFIVVNQGQINRVGGTSASTPCIAAFISLWNGVRMRSGQPPVGFVNPLFYAHPYYFTDIVAGTNAVSCPACGAYATGFDAVPGWDPITGLGVPNFQKFAALDFYTG